MTEIKRAINWLQQEIAYLKAAPDGNGCPMTEEWQEQIDVFTTCLEALRGMEWHPVSEAPSKSGNYLAQCVLPGSGGAYTTVVREMQYDSPWARWLCEDIIITNWAQMPNLPEVRL